MLTREEEPFELGDIAEAEDQQSPVQQRPEPEPSETQPVHPEIPGTHWGGFFRRAFAFLLDLAAILALSIVMFFMCYVGYKVGLSAHGRKLTWEPSSLFFVWFTWGWIGVATAYFVIFHGLEGKTIGKWLLKLRVVGAEQSAVTYRQAFLRWIGLVGFAPVLLGFLWVLWSREKRGWHDFLARTWVIRD